MAPPSADWQSILQTKVPDYDPDNGSEEDSTEQLGVKFMKVSDFNWVRYDRSNSSS